MDRAPVWLDIARSRLGEAAIAGPETNPYVLGLYAACGYPEIRTDDVPWCAAFLGAVLAECGIPGTGSLAAASYAGFGDALPAPKVGAIAVWANHVAFVSAVLPDGRVMVIGGNQGRSQGISAVTEATYSIDASRSATYRWPVAIKTAADLDAAGSRTIAKGKADVVTGTLLAATGASALPQGQPPAAPDVAAISSQIGLVEKGLGLAKSLGDALVNHPLAVIVFSVGAYLVASGVLLRVWRTDDANSGRNLGR